MRLRNFLKTQSLKINRESDNGTASIQFSKLNAEIKFKQLDLAHLDFEGKPVNLFDYRLLLITIRNLSFQV